MGEHIIDVVTGAFVVIVGVGIAGLMENGLGKDDLAFRTDAAQTASHRDSLYWVCYALGLMILVTVILRFLLGSDTHLRHAYARVSTNPVSVGNFIADVSFLMFYGAFLTGAALSNLVRTFMGWLSLSAGAGVAWSVIALIRGERDLVFWWLTVNAIQFLLTFGLYIWACQIDQEVGKGRRQVLGLLGIAWAWYAIIFGFDLQKILNWKT
jgi:hypothetical protein